MSWKKLTAPERAQLMILLDKAAWDPTLPIRLHPTITRLQMELKRATKP